jgi:hypothetical protein
MKNILVVLLISCFCLNFVSCTATTNTADTGTFFFREVKGAWGWYSEADDDTEGKYIGEIKKGKPHGQGTYTRYSGPRSSVTQLSMLIPGMSISTIFAITLWQLLNHSSQDKLSTSYTGHWKRGEKHGEGTYFFPNRDRYEGKWKKGQQQGQGTYFFLNGDKYEGKWEGGKKHGQGIYFFSDGDTFVGQWKDGNPHGKGMYTYPSGEKYIGKWKDGKKQMQGPLILSN